MAKVAHMLEETIQLKGVSAELKKDVDKMLGRPVSVLFYSNPVKAWTQQRAVGLESVCERPLCQA